MNTTEAIHLNFDTHPPLFPPYIKGLFTRRKGMKDGIALPRIGTTWKDLTIDRKHLDRFIGICELNPRQEVPFDYPLSLVFPSHMHILGHARFPLSPFTMLQTGIRIRQYRALALNTNYSLHCRIHSRRDTAKGMNLEICSQFCLGSETVWESINTYLFRSVRTNGSDGATAQKKTFCELAQTSDTNSFSIPAKKRFAFATLSGDLNGIHYSSHYARLFGFRRDFCHAQRSIAICLDKLPFLEKVEQIQLDAALKGPAYYENQLLLKSSTDQDKCRVDILCADNPKPALVMEIQNDIQNS